MACRRAVVRHGATHVASPIKPICHGLALRWWDFLECKDSLCSGGSVRVVQAVKTAEVDLKPQLVPGKTPALK